MIRLVEGRVPSGYSLAQWQVAFVGPIQQAWIGNGGVAEDRLCGMADSGRWQQACCWPASDKIDQLFGCRGIHYVIVEGKGGGEGNAPQQRKEKYLLDQTLVAQDTNIADVSMSCMHNQPSLRCRTQSQGAARSAGASLQTSWLPRHLPLERKPGAETF